MTDGKVVAHTLQQFHAAYSRHHQVGDNHIGMILVYLLEPLFALMRHIYIIGVTQLQLQHAAQVDVVFNHQHRGTVGLGRCCSLLFAWRCRFRFFTVGRLLPGINGCRAIVEIHLDILVAIMFLVGMQQHREHYSLAQRHVFCPYLAMVHVDIFTRE